MGTASWEPSPRTATASTGITEPSGRAFASTQHRINWTARFAIALDLYPLQLGHAPGLVPIRNIDVGILVDKTSVSRAEVGESNVARKQFVVGPLILVRIVAQEGNRHIVFIKNGDAPLQLRDHGVVTPKTYLARTTQVQRHVADKLAIEIVMAEPPVFAVAHQQEGLPVTQVHGQPVAAVAQAVRASLPGISRLVIAGFVELEDA